MSTSTSISKAETDIILNKANVALARSQRLVASWLPAQTTEELSNTKSEEELQREEDEIFTAVPETLGVGAPLPTKAADGSWNRTEIDSSNDKLRRQLLGRNYKKVMAASGRQAGKPVGPPGTKSDSQTGVPSQDGGNIDDDEDDDDEGRTASIGKKLSSKKRKQEYNNSSTMETADSANNTGKDEEGNEDDEDGGKSVQTQGRSSQSGLGSRSRKKATSFLDEILAERSKKRKKR